MTFTEIEATPVNEIARTWQSTAGAFTRGEPIPTLVEEEFLSGDVIYYLKITKQVGYIFLGGWTDQRIDEKVRECCGIVNREHWHKQWVVMKAEEAAEQVKQAVASIKSGNGFLGFDGQPYHVF